MKKVVSFKFLVVSLIFLFSSICYAQSSSSRELITHTKEYDGKVVIYAGEAIGDIMVRGDFAWVNVNDGQNAIGIWLDRTLIQDVTYTGGYKTKGDWVEITGFFHRACPQHGGDLDIHAQRLRKISSGRQLSERLNLNKKNFTLVLFIILGIVWILRRLKIK